MVCYNTAMQVLLSNVMFFIVIYSNCCYTCHCCSFRDRASHNDVIGTTNLCMSKISAPGGEIEGELCFLAYPQGVCKAGV